MLTIEELLLHIFTRYDAHITVLTYDTTTVIWSGFYKTAPAWVKEIPTVQMYVNHICDSWGCANAVDVLTLIASKRYEKAPD